jgi:hypothetical protein
MLTGAFKFMHGTDRPHVHGEARAKIISLIDEIQTIYKQHICKSTGRTCDICGAGDKSEIHKVSDVVPGYEHREHESPCLCYNHTCGWRQSYFRLENKRKSMALGHFSNTVEARLDVIRTVFPERVLSDEETDLQFAKYLANQLMKAKHAINKQP